MLPPQGFAKGGIASLNPMAREMAEAGRYGDTMLAHISPVEAQILRRYGGSGTINPMTGMPEFFLKKMFKKLGKAVKKFANTTIGKIVIGTALFMVAGPAAASMLGASAGGAPPRRCGGGVQVPCARASVDVTRELLFGAWFCFSPPGEGGGF
jgi:hypothetical protein